MAPSAAPISQNTRSNSDSQSHSPDESFFNDLSQQAPPVGLNEQQPKSKRMACVLCRKRKLRCDGGRPACATCTRLSHDCQYDEVRKKSGPRKGYVKALEARLAQVETQLHKTQDPADSTSGASDSTSNVRSTQYSNIEAGQVSEFADIDIGGMNEDATWKNTPVLSDLNLPYMKPGLAASEPVPNSDFTANDSQLPENLDAFYSMSPMRSERFRPTPADIPPPTWDSLISLGLEEPLPSQDVIDELNQIYFDKIHPNAPIFHRPRFLMAMQNSLPSLRPPVALQYAVWTNAAVWSDKYENLHEHFYKRCRHYLERDEMTGQGEAMVNIATVQTWYLMSLYEFKVMMFPRAWMSTGRMNRLSLMMGLHRVDGGLLDVKQCLYPPKDWIEKEERRRTFWMSFCQDRYASIGTGWPMMIDEQDITTNLPVSDDAFERGIPEASITLAQATEAGGAAFLNPFGGIILLSSIFGRNLHHLHRPAPNDNDSDLNGPFWTRHRQLDDILLNTSLSLPEHLRVPFGLRSPSVVFMNMCLHTATICLHQAAIFKADKGKIPIKVSTESKLRCITAAAEVAQIMKLASHQDLASASPFTCFCLYVAARVFVQYLKSRPRDEMVKSSIRFLLSAMVAVKRKNPLAESFLVQLDVDLEGAGLDELRSAAVRAAGSVLTHTFSMPGAPETKNAGMDGCMGHNVFDMDAQEVPYHARLRNEQTMTFGTNYLAAHPPSDRSEHQHNSLGMNQGDYSTWPNSATDNTAPILGFKGIMPVQSFNQTTMPTRGKTPSTQDPSPRTFSDDMDTSGFGSNSHPTPSSQRQNSSATSFSPPANLSHEDSYTSTNGLSHTDSFSNPISHQTTNSDHLSTRLDPLRNPRLGGMCPGILPDSDFGLGADNHNTNDNITNSNIDFAASSTPSAMNETDFSQFVRMMPGQSSALFDMAESMGFSKTGLTPGADGSFKTGFTPGPDGESNFGSMNGVDWEKLMGEVGGWEGVLGANGTGGGDLDVD